MRHRHGPVTAALSVAVASLLAAGPAAARMPLDVVVRTVPSQTRPDLVVVVVPTTGAAEQTAAVLDQALRKAVEGSGRFELARLIDLLDAENAKVRNDKVKEGDDALAAARKLYDDLDTIKALSEADRAIKAYAETDLTQHMDELIGAWIFKIASLVANGENKAAELEMDKLLVVAPGAQFSPNFFPPEQIARAEKARKAVAAAKETMEITTAPAGAEVYVDGVFRGVSPVTVTGLAAGDHYVSAKSAGYALAQQKARPGPVELTLRKSEAWPRYETLVDSVKKDPEGAGRDRAAKAFGTWAGVEQVLLAIVDVAPGAPQAKVTALRLESRDGHNAAYVQKNVPAGEGASAEADALGSALLAKDDPRRGGPTTHFASDPAGGKKLAGYVLLGTGAVLLASGVVSGLQANSKSSEFRNLPQTDVRAPSVASSGRTFAVIADVSYLLGVVAAGAGGYLAFGDQLTGSDKKPKPAAEPKKEEAKEVKKEEPKKEAPSDEEDDEDAAAAEKEKARKAAEEEAARLKKQKEEEAKKKKRQADEDDLRNY